MPNTKNSDRPEAGKPEVPEEPKERPVAEGDLLGNFVRRTDNGFRGVEEEGLIGQDVGDEDEQEGEADDAEGRR